MKNHLTFLQSAIFFCGEKKNCLKKLLYLFAVSLCSIISITAQNSNKYEYRKSITPESTGGGYWDSGDYVLSLDYENWNKYNYITFGSLNTYRTKDAWNADVSERSIGAIRAYNEPKDWAVKHNKYNLQNHFMDLRFGFLEANADPCAFHDDCVGSNVSETWLMTLLKNGNLGIGTETPKVKLEVGKDVPKSTSLLLDVHGHAIFNNDGDNLTAVSINTDVRLQDAALTVGGPTYIGGWGEIESGDVKSEYLKKYYLWVQKGVVSEDFVFSPKPQWKDMVFRPDYKLPLLSEIEKFVKENHHLPGIPSEEQVSKVGYSVHELNNAFLEKIEQLMLYSISQEKKIALLESRLNQLSNPMKTNKR